ncbi:hypothetical protein [Bifidobacterium canis]|uniref:Scaffolding protein n=1 Tax=Bifidobacterium canis TaxID=2610880 RepID=A0A7K1J832_9BIFI|nr:hypothetical protein [Bifidobacterium canis]MUH60600.1 hypothetical protein [Bifidobacterium canis]
MADNQTDEPETTEPETGEETQTGQSQEDNQKPDNPWGDDFDASKAWKLVQNLREENKGLKEKNRAYEDEKLSDKEKADRDLAEAREELEKVRQERTLAQIQAKYPTLTDDDMTFLGTGTEQELMERAAKLASRIGSNKETEPKHMNPLHREPKGGSDPTGSHHTDFIREAILNNH